MKAMIFVLMGCALSCAAQQTCSRSWNCKEKLVTIITLSQAELNAIKQADAKVADAQAEAQAARDKIIEAHGGFVLHYCANCMMVSGERMGDEVEWKEPYLILTKRWLPEL